MAFPTGSSTVDHDSQTTVTIVGGTASVADSAFSVAGDVVSGNWINSLNAREMAMVAFFDWNTTAPDANSSVNLYARPMNIDSTNDGDIPDANFQHNFIGSFPVNDVLTNQYIELASLGVPTGKNSAEFQFYIENKTGETLVAGWTLKLTPKAMTPST